jgi:hypothetical protein
LVDKLGTYAEYSTRLVGSILAIVKRAPFVPYPAPSRILISGLRCPGSVVLGMLDIFMLANIYKSSPERGNHKYAACLDFT